MPDKKQTIIFILGPTASGKSKTAVRFSEIVRGEIISCDSMQVYRGMEILTQAPVGELLGRVSHHLVGIIPPEEEFNAAGFVELAAGVVDEVISRARVPVLSGGTGLYVKAFLDGLFQSPPKDEEFRERLEQEAAEKGNMYLYSKLQKIDPQAALKIDPQNLRRVIRALEIFELTGKTFSEKKAETKGMRDKYEPRLFALKVPRDVLIERINKRVEKMFAMGLADEVKSLMKRKISLTASKALGVKEVERFLAGELSLKQTKEEIKIKTRQYAKRQMTWLRAVEGVEWVDAERPADEIALDISDRAGLAR